MLATLIAIAIAQTDVERPGRWYPDRLTPEEGARIEKLEALGYVGATEPDDPRSGVVTHLPSTQPGMTLYTSGHRPEAVLIHSNGTVAQQWHLPFIEAFPELPELARHKAAQTWRRTTLRPDGTLLAIHEGIGLVALDRGSKRLWAQNNRAHHDVQVDPDGTIWTLTRRPLAQPGGLPLLEDFLTQLASDGTERHRISLLTALRESPWGHWLDTVPAELEGDITHTNSLHRIQGPGVYHPAFQPGRWLFSSRHLDALFVLDPITRQVVWASKGPWKRQHDAELGPSGKLWLFDNRGAGPHSRALALDPSEPTRIVWSYGAQTSPPLHSDVLGTVQELSNGHLLITESTRGRCMEVTPAGEVVWDFHNPHTVVVNGRRLVAAIFECVRIPQPNWVE